MSRFPWRSLLVGGCVLSATLGAGCTQSVSNSSLQRTADSRPAPDSTEAVESIEQTIPAEPGLVTPPTPVQLTSFKAPEQEAIWSSFRGPTGMGTSETKGFPLAWSLTENIAWRADLPGPGASSPIVFGDRIYITAYSGFFVPGEEGSKENLTRHLIALKRADGSLIWEQKVKARLPEEDRIRDHGFAASTPAADADGVVVFFGKTGVIAFNHAGNEVWRREVGDKTHGWGSSASPVFYKDLVFINASVESESLFALDRKTGEVKWQQKKIREAWNTPVLVRAESGRLELVVATQGKILAFNPDTGEPLWNCDTDITWYMVPSVVAADGVVFSLGGRSGIAGLAVRAGGSGDVTDANRLWTSKKGCNVPSPIYLDKHLYWMHQDLGVAYCAKADTGEIVYEERIARSQVYASALLADGKIYYLTRDGKTYVVAAKPKFEQLALNDMSDRNDRNNIFNASPAVDGSRLLIRNDKHLYCIGK
ncbi:PQQ-binding-like beta-propeller repeat protein [Anatilimnocola floriformis]|uniref:PQQ-binding-like beta-propeller repeat protein n=1 Tax=Anatilimnocola floriformis TaxID=2948575 RepID=UPI0020C39D9B|nr:PQQ-binding-like beta-propeller repeat protein [Anatilimnocola floriformis]